MKGWFCPKHGYICAENECSRIMNHRFIMGCNEILELRNDIVTFKLVEARQ